MRVYPIVAVPAPRQTGRDRFKPRPCVLRYRAYRDEVGLHHVQIPQPFYHVLFVISMPRSWTLTKCNQMRGMPHQTTPDKDNLEKALLDSVFGSDAHVWDGRVTKIWGDHDYIVISNEPIDVTLPMDTRRFSTMVRPPYMNTL